MTYRPYTTASAFNKPIPASPPIHPGTSKMVSAVDHWLLGGTSYDQYKEWLGPRARCLYFRGDTTKLPPVPVYVNYLSGKGYVCATSPKMTVPMPAWFAGLLKDPATSRDHIAVIADSKTGDVWEMWKLTPPGVASQNITCSSTRWNAITCNHFPADTISHTGYDAVSAVSESYIHMPAGLLVPEDFADTTTPIQHAIGFFTRCDQSGAGPYPPHVPPAKAGKGSEYYGIPYGGRLQLNPAVNIASHASVLTRPEPWRSALIKILHAMQTHGLVLMDGTGGIGAGGYAAAHPSSVAQGVYNGKTGFKYPWDGMRPYDIGVPYDLMAEFRVIDWTKWTGA